MKPHRFDPLSASLGLLAAAAAALVAFNRIESISAGWWFALAALVIGLGLIPWTRPSRRPAAPQPDTPNPDDVPDTVSDAAAGAWPTSDRSLAMDKPDALAYRGRRLSPE